MKNDDIDKIISEDESEKEDTFKPSQLFLTISSICLMLVFGSLKGLCISGSLQMKSKYLINQKRKNIQIRF